MVGGLASWLTQLNFTKSYIFCASKPNFDFSCTEEASSTQYYLKFCQSFCLCPKEIPKFRVLPAIFVLIGPCLAIQLPIFQDSVYLCYEKRYRAEKQCDSFACLKNVCNTEELHQLLPHSPTESLSSAAAYRKCILFLRVNHSDILCPFASAKTTLFFNTVLHTSSARSSFFSGSFAPATRHGTKKEFLTEENCNLNAR